MESVALSYKTLGAYPQWLSWMWRRAPGFFDVVAYEGNPTNDFAGTDFIKTNLGVAPEMMWTKRRDGSFKWAVWHKDLDQNPTFPNQSFELILNENVGQASA